MEWGSTLVEALLQADLVVTMQSRYHLLYYDALGKVTSLSLKVTDFFSGSKGLEPIIFI